MCMWPLDAPADVQRRVFERFVPSASSPTLSNITSAFLTICLLPFLDFSVCSDLEFERAAAMALINLQFDWALSFLSRASECKRIVFPEVIVGSLFL